MQSLSRRFIHHFHTHNLNYPNAFLLFSTAAAAATATTTTTTDSFANYLVDSLGFSHQQALSASNKLSKTNAKVNLLKFDTNADSVVGFFKTHGFDNTLLIKIVSCKPRLLFCKVDKTLKPKFDFFRNEGFSGSDIIRVISTNPNILSMGIESAIVPAVQLFRQIMVCDSHVIDVLEKLRVWSFVGVVGNLLPNVALLNRYGIPIELIRQHLVKKPTTFLRKPEIFKEMVTRVERKLGICHDSPMFLYGLFLVSVNCEENIESKCRMFKSFGWTQSDVETFMMKNVYCFTMSNSNIKKKLDFLMNELKLKPADLTSCCALLTCSLEKRIMPRHKVLLILKEKCLLEKYPSFSRAICMSEPCFFKKFVLPFKDVYKVYVKHTGCSMGMLTQESADILS